MSKPTQGHCVQLMLPVVYKYQHTLNKDGRPVMNVGIKPNCPILQYSYITPLMFLSVHRAVCEQSADPAGAVKAAWGWTAGSVEGNARQGPRPGEGELTDMRLSVWERSVIVEQRTQTCAAVNVLKIIVQFTGRQMCQICYMVSFQFYFIRWDTTALLSPDDDFTVR